MSIKFVNISNHPSSRWSEDQREAALRLAREEARRRGFEGDVEIIDIPFPEVDPLMDTSGVVSLARSLADKVPSGTMAAMVHGEYTLVYSLVHLLHRRGVPVYAATSRRVVTELGDGRKVSEFKFVMFRPYPYLCELVASQ